jgi:MFS transporter, ACS family, hexuronate transporter
LPAHQGRVLTLHVSSANSILIGAAIAISYLDRQALPVAVKAITNSIPLTNEQFSELQSAFLFTYAFMYAGGR